MAPKRCCKAGSSTFSTTPSVSKGSFRRASAWVAMKASMASRSPSPWAGITPNPQPPRRAMERAWSSPGPPLHSACQGRKDRPRAATSRLSSSFMVPLAALRGLANRSSPRASRWRFNSSQRLRERNTSPRTSRRPGASSGSSSGISARVRAFSVTRSPVSPSPRVMASTSWRPS